MENKTYKKSKKIIATKKAINKPKHTKVNIKNNILTL